MMTTCWPRPTSANMQTALAVSMTAGLLAMVCHSSLPLQTTRTAVFYSTAQDTNTANVKREVICRMLYPPNVRNRPSPTGAWRPNIGCTLQCAIPSAWAHETIEHAWKLYQRHLRKKRDAELQHKGMAELEEIDPILLKEANKRGPEGEESC